MVNKTCISIVSEENKLHYVYMEIIVFILRTLHKRIILFFVPYFAHLVNTFTIIILNKLLLLFLFI